MGHRCVGMGYGVWHMGYGVWDMWYGLWHMGYGVWGIGHGMVSGMGFLVRVWAVGCGPWYGVLGMVVYGSGDGGGAQQ